MHVVQPCHRNNFNIRGIISLYTFWVVIHRHSIMLQRMNDRLCGPRTLPHIRAHAIQFFIYYFGAMIFIGLPLAWLYEHYRTIPNGYLIVMFLILVPSVVTGIIIMMYTLRRGEIELDLAAMEYTRQLNDCEGGAK